VWVELLVAFVVEGYREFLEWWQTRPNWLGGPVRATEEARQDEHVISASAGDIRETVEAIIDRHGRKHVGLAVAVWQDGTSWTFARGRSSADRPHLPGPGTIFEIGSVTKVFTALLLADMAEEQLVALDDPVRSYLPAGIELPVRGRPITLLDLATQTSGLPRLPKGLIRHSLRNRANPYAGFTVEQFEHTIADARLKRRPGEKMRYSNFGFGLLGHVLAVRAGMDYEQLVRERICMPLGLDDTGISIPLGARARFADGHNRRGRRVPHWDLPTLAGAGALRSTAVDLVRFLELQLREPTTRLGRAAHATQVPRAKRGPLVQCLGWASLPLRRSGQRTLWHNGGTGGFRSFVGFVPGADLGVVVLSNCSRSVDRMGFEILEAMIELGPPVAPQAKSRALTA
jgi:D-alanyl-D-alanine-carboxypeptidase/D-alanyl-D-alanine-endopeptidase